MAKKKKEETYKLIDNGKEVNFTLSDLSDEGKAQFQRANELARELMRHDQKSNELRFLANNYIRFVLDELNKEVDEKEEK